MEQQGTAGTALTFGTLNDLVHDTIPGYYNNNAAASSVTFSKQHNTGANSVAPGLQTYLCRFERGNLTIQSGTGTLTASGHRERQF